MLKGTSSVLVARIPDRDNVAMIPVISSQEQFRHFANEVAPLFAAQNEKISKKECPWYFASGDLFVYPLAFRVGFKSPIHPIVAELLGRLNVSPHRVIPNTWRILTVVPSLNAHMDIELGLNDLPTAASSTQADTLC